MNLNTPKYSKAGLMLVALAAGACTNLDIPDYYAPSLTSLEQGATAPQISVAAVGLIAFSRDVQAGLASGNGTYLADLGQQGREGIRLDPSNPQNVLDNFVGGARGPASGGWNNMYRSIRQANVLINAVPSATGLTDAEKEAVLGFAKTMKALTFQRLNNAWDAAGQPIAVDVSTSSGNPPVASNAEVKAYIVQLLDEAKIHLQAGGSSFPFSLGPGFVGFDTPTTFLTFNRGLRARAAIYLNDYTGALAALGESFVDIGSPLALGVYDSYSTRAGDQPNPLYEPVPRQIFSLPENEADALLQVDGVTKDARLIRKTRALVPSQVIHGITVSSVFTIYTSQDAPVPIIRNEELILLRAEANWGLGNSTAALDDINFIRVNSGNLPSLGAYPGDPAFLDELLYNRRYSLIWEAGHRWVDMRRHGRLPQLIRAMPTHKIWVNFQLPQTECTPRTPEPAGCQIPAFF